MQLLPALEAGGVERSTLEIAAALVADGQRSLVVSAGGRLVAALRSTGSIHHRLDVGAKSLRTLARIGALRRLIESERPDILHVRSRLPAWIALAALRGLRGPRPRLVTTVHGLNSPGRYSAVLTRGERVICVSQTVRAHLVRHYPTLDAQRLVVIPRGIAPADFPHGFHASTAWRAAVEDAHPALRGGRWLLLPARGTRLKGHAEAIALLAALRARGHDLRLWLLGADEPGRARYVDELRAQVERSGLASCVAITPPRGDVREAIAASALVLQLSNRPEAFGRTVVEALALGRPVLGVDHGGVGELLAAHFPEGRCAPGDAGDALRVAEALLGLPLPLPPRPLPTLAAMQRATLDVYEALLDGR